MTLPSFSLQEKVQQLEQLEEYFQRPDMDLEEAIEKHKAALQLAKDIVAYLDKAESTIQKIDMSLAGPADYDSK